MSESFLAAATMRHLDAVGAIEPAVMRARSSVYGRGASKYNEETMASWKDLGIDAQAAVESKDWETAATLMESCVQRRPDWYKGYLSYMFVLGKLARWDEAERVAHAGIQVLSGSGGLAESEPSPRDVAAGAGSRGSGRIPSRHGKLTNPTGFYELWRRSVGAPSPRRDNDVAQRHWST